MVAVGVPLIVFGVVMALLFMPLANSRMVSAPCSRPPTLGGGWARTQRGACFLKCHVAVSRRALTHAFVPAFVPVLYTRDPGGSHVPWSMVSVLVRVTPAQSTFGLIVNLTQFIGMSAQQNVDWPAELDPFFELFSFTNLNM